MIPWFNTKFSDKEKINLAKVIDENYINDGGLAREFEKKLANYLNVNHAVSVTSGTSGITLALLACGLEQGDEVIIPNVTFIATANAVKLAGLVPVLVDIETKFFTIDVDKIRKKITSKTKAIVPVEVNGRAANYEEINKICKEYNLFLVTDSAEALGSKYENQFLGTTGQAGCFSFSANKTLTTGQGGLVVTNDSNIHDRLRELKDQGRRNQGTGGNDLHPVLGFNFKFTNLQAAVGHAQFEELDSRLAKANQRDSWYKKYLDPDLKNKINLIDKNDSGIVLQWTDALAENRDELAKFLDSKGIGNRPFWYPLHTQKPYEKNDVEFKNSIDVCNKGLWLPSYFDLKEEEVILTCEAIKEFYEK